jgi:hypothetical protein
MMPRVTVAHKDEAFREELATILRLEGYEVIPFNDSAFATEPPRDSDQLEIAITQFIGSYAGVRIRVTGLARDASFAGPLQWVFTEHASVADIVDALRRLPSSHS